MRVEAIARRAGCTINEISAAGNHDHTKRANMQLSFQVLPPAIYAKSNSVQ